MIIFLIPAYNEAKNLPSLLKNIQKKMIDQNFSYKVIIINDGSTDDTVHVVESLKKEIPVDIYSHFPNKGVGETFRKGFSHVLKIAQENDIIVTLEADNTSDPNILAELISKIKVGNDIALASCYAKEGAVLRTPLLRVILSKGANFLLHRLISIPNIHTYSSFYRSYKLKALKEMDALYGEKWIEEDGFECMVEMLLKFSRHKQIKIVEVPMVLDGHKLSRKSKMPVIRTIKGFLKVIFKESIFYRIKQKHTPVLSSDFYGK